MRTFGPYQLVRRLGSGGMAETFLAVRRGPGGFEQHVCVKRILPALESDPELVRMFMEEARLAAQLRHANITQVVDFGVVEGSHYLALELVDGVDLRTLLASLRQQKRTLEPAIAIFIAAELTQALEVAHTPDRTRSAVIHRDISPSNILLSRAGEVYLTDFGVARAIGLKRRTQSGVVRGKVPYMAAEYASRGVFDARSDLFALGVVLFEALAGQRPFEGVTDLDTLSRIQAGVHPPLAELCPSAPPQLVAIVEQLLMPAPEERFQAASALAQALAYVAPPPTVARQLAEQVRASRPSSLRTASAHEVELSAPGLTGPLANRGAAPAYPGVAPAEPAAPTRTHDPPKPASIRATLDAPSWASTDPAQIRGHDRGPSSPPHLDAPPVPITRIRVPEKRASRGCLWTVFVLLGLAAFAAAGAGAYVFVALGR